MKLPIFQNESIPSMVALKKMEERATHS